MEEGRRPFFVTLLSMQYGAAGLGYLTMMLYLFSAALGASNFGLYVLVNTVFVWIPLSLIGVYLFMVAKGLYDMKRYAWILAMIGSVFWLIVSTALFIAAIALIEPTIQMAQPPDLRPLVSGMMAGMPQEAIDAVASAVQGMASALVAGVAGVYYLIKGFFLSSAVYNGIVVIYLVRVRSLFSKAEAKAQSQAFVPAVPGPASGGMGSS
ncbi:MAG TPA: hypothetical protein VEG31_03755 [Thermoproteota archaeon]|nr:hypothetical protein [Thermoproteota archaeon]